MQTIKQILHILKSKGFNEEKTPFIDKSIVIGFNTDKKPIISDNLTKTQLNYPVTRVYIRIGNMPYPIRDSRITATMRREGTVDPYLILSDNPLMNIDPKVLRKKVYYNADNYSAGKFKNYTVGDYCLHKGVLYRLVKQIPYRESSKDSKFDPEYWQPVKHKECRFIFMVVDVPDKFLNSDIYLKKFMNPYIYNSLMESHGTVMNSKSYDAALEYYGSEEKLKKALCDVTGYDMHIMKSTVEDCYIIYDSRRVGNRKETDA